MTTTVLFPQLSEETSEGVLVTWFVEEGDDVAEGDLVASVQVEKVDDEVYAPAAGVVQRLLVAPGDVVAQGAPIAELGEAGRPAAEGGPGGSEARVVASPSARRVARELAVDLATVVGSGPGGRVVEDDVRAAAAAGGGGVPTAAAGQPMSGPRRLLAERMHAWKESTAQITLTSEVDVTELAATDPPWAAALVRACGLVLGAHPLLTRRWDGELLVPASSLDVGVAVALDDGLVVPVVRAADTKPLAVIAEEVADLAHRARAATLQMAEVTGAVFAMTSLGRYPVDAFTPLLPAPQTAILGVGRARPAAVVRDGAVVPGVVLTLSLTVDHRVIDGAPAAAFLADLAEVVGDPSRL